MQNVKELIASLTDNYQKLEASERDIALGKELNNTAGKILKAVSLKLSYGIHLDRKEKIDYLEDAAIESPSPDKNKLIE